MYWNWAQLADELILCPHSEQKRESYYALISKERLVYRDISKDKTWSNGLSSIDVDKTMLKDH